MYKACFTSIALAGNQYYFHLWYVIIAKENTKLSRNKQRKSDDSDTGEMRLHDTPISNTCGVTTATTEQWLPNTNVHEVNT